MYNLLQGRGVSFTGPGPNVRTTHGPAPGPWAYATCCLPQIVPLPAGERPYVEKLTQSLPDFAFVTLLV